MHKTLLASAILVGLALSGTASAGVYVGGGVNTNYTDVSVPGFTMDGKNNIGVGVVLGYSHNFGNVYTAGELSYQNKSGEYDIDDGTGNKAKGEMTNAKSFNVKLGYQFSPTMTAYAKFGRGNADNEVSYQGNKETTNFDTKTLGAGLIYSLDKNLAITSEYRQTSNVDGIGDITAKTFDLGVMYKF